jgi:hypothetical protein
MHPSARAALTATALVAASLVPGGWAAADAAADTAATGPSVAVHGHLLVVASERPGGHPAYGVAMADGDIVEVRGAFAPTVRTGDVFDGRLALPSSVTRALARRTPTSDPARAALRIVDRRSLTLTVAGTPTVTADETAATATAHQQYVAAIDNKGALGQTDTQLLGHVSTVGTYWQHESNGAISSVVVPATVKHYNTGLSTTDCGLGNDFFDVVQEAAAKFPGANPYSGSNQLVLFVPPGCVNGNIVGMGTIGSSFASGGALVVKAQDAIEGTYAHETGHNYGFNHANARYAGTSMEYYGVYDVMGYALAGYNQLTALSTPFRVFQGVTDPGEIQDVPLGDRSAPVHVSATIAPRGDDSGLRSVRVVNPDTGEPLYLDYRSGTGPDVSAFYTAQGYYLNSSQGPVRYGPGVTISALHNTSGVDTLVVDGSGHTSLGAGASWTNASGNLTVHVSALGASGADVTVDFTPPQDFTTVGTPVVGGTIAVGGTVSLDLGTWSPTPTTTSIRWTADGSPVPHTDDKSSFVVPAALAGRQLVATVTASHAGYRTTTVPSAAVTVATGTIPVTADPAITGTVQVGFTLHAQTATWGSTVSTVSSTWQWRVDGVDVPGATSADFVVPLEDVGEPISVAQRLTATGYQTRTLVSAASVPVPAPVIAPAPTPTVSGTPRVGAPLTALPGTWMTGVTLSYQWYVAGQPVLGATGPAYTPVAGDLGQTVQVEVTGSRAGYPDATRTSAETVAVALGVLVTTKPTIGGTPVVGNTLTAKPGAWTTGATFAYAWYADGVHLKGETGKKLVLTKAQKGTHITVKVTGSLTGYATASRTSARTARVT